MIEATGVKSLLGEPLTAPSVPLVAASDIITPRVTPIIPRPDPSSVQPPRTVIHR
jgi:hypothetical protein